MKNLISTDTGALILRVALGIVLLAHSLYLKMMIFSLAGTADFFVSIGLPAILAYGVFILEVVAGTALILGLYSRFFAASVTPVLLGATWVHASNGWLFSNSGGGWEYPLFLFFMAIVQITLGDGKYSLRRYYLSQQTIA